VVVLDYDYEDDDEDEEEMRAPGDAMAPILLLS
jgi:hypothetical protein